MKVYKNIQAAWQAPAGTTNVAFHQGQALAVRIVPNFTTAGLAGVFLPRTILVDDNVKRNNIISLGDSGWFLIDRNFLQVRDDDSDHPFARTVGPRATLRFGVEQAGVLTNDNWNVWVAEDLLDLLAGPNSVVDVTRDSATGLYFPFVSNSGLAASADSQIYDATAVSATPLNSGTLNISQFRDIFIRIAGFTAPTTRTIGIVGVRADNSLFPLWQPTAIGATITDAELGMGEGANLPATPTGTTSVGLSFSGPLPTQIQFTLTAGTAGDTPRVTIWGRSSS